MQTNSWFGPKRLHPSPVTAGKFPGVDVVLITHDHYNHLKKTTLVDINQKVKQFFVPSGIGAHRKFKNLGFRRMRFTPYTKISR
jgi:L-ascorbate metabolism protein UlaG (beta-lactamase superfamily)